MSHWRAGVILPIILLGTWCVTSCNKPAEPGGYAVTVGEARLTVEVAADDASRERGLMFRTRLDESAGMIFVYDEEAPLVFWMKNTKIPLSIAFLDSRRVVRDIQDMSPMTEELHTSRVPASYALEVNQGWFTRNHVTVGTPVTFSPRLEALLKDRPR